MLYPSLSNFHHPANPPPISTLSDMISESKRGIQVDGMILYNTTDNATAVSEGEPCSSGIHDEGSLNYIVMHDCNTLK